MGYPRQITFAKSLAYEAGEIIRKYFMSNDIGTELKEDSTPVTIADTTINQLVIDRVKENFPDCGVIGEEDSYEPKRENVWVVDPIDGTIPFSLGIPVSTFCLAYVEDGFVKASVVYDPFQDRLFSATKDGGAYVNSDLIKVSSKSDFADSYSAFGGHVLSDFVATLNENRSTRILDLFSYAYASSKVATGDFVAAGMTYGSPWDAAAVSLIVEEAGGRSTDLCGKPRKYNEWGDGILMSNGIVHDEIVKMIDYENSKDRQ